MQAFIRTRFYILLISLYSVGWGSSHARAGLKKTCTQRIMSQMLIAAQHLLRLYRPTRQGQSCLHRIYVETVSSDIAMLYSVIVVGRALICPAECFRFSSPRFSHWFKSRLQCDLWLATSSHLSIPMIISLMSLLQMSMKRISYHLPVLLPTASSPLRSTFGIHPSVIRYTCAIGERVYRLGNCSLVRTTTFLTVRLINAEG